MNGFKSRRATTARTGSREPNRTSSRAYFFSFSSPLARSLALADSDRGARARLVREGHLFLKSSRDAVDTDGGREDDAKDDADGE